MPEIPKSMRYLRRLLGLVALSGTLLAIGAGASPAAPDASGSVEAAAQCADPCVITGVVKHGAGKVTSNPAGIDCGNMCFQTWSQIDPVYLIAQPEIGQVFQGWTGCQEVRPDNSCAVLASAQLICVTATFSGTGPPAQQCPPPANPQCSDALDNDGNGALDFPSDPGCSSPSDTTEYTPPMPPPPPPAKWPARCTIPGSPYGDVITGTPKNDVICGRGGNDRIYGGGGNDTLVGEKGRDKLYGGSGNDLLIARDRARGDLAHGGPGRDRSRGDRGDTQRSVESRG